MGVTFDEMKLLRKRENSRYQGRISVNLVPITTILGYLPLDSVTDSVTDSVNDLVY